MQRRARDRDGARTFQVLSFDPLLPIRQQRAQTAPPVKDLGSHGPLGNPENSGDLGMRISFDIEQDDRGAAPLRQLGERGTQPVAKLVSHYYSVGTRPPSNQRRV